MEPGGTPHLAQPGSPGRATTSAGEAAAGAQTLEDLAALLRDLRRRHARERRDSPLTYRELAGRTGWSQAAIAEYFTGRTLPPTDRFDALVEVLGARPAERGALADARDRLEENQRRARSRPARRPEPPAGDSAPASGTVPAPGPAPAPAGARERPAYSGPRQLPPDTALFTGRDGELASLLALAGNTAARDVPGAVVISAIDGMGGVGKSALAVHAAHRLAERFPDGQLFLDLYGFTQGKAPREPGDALATLLCGLGVPLQRIPADPDARGRSTATVSRAPTRCWCWTTPPTRRRYGRCCPPPAGAWY